MWGVFPPYMAMLFTLHEASSATISYISAGMSVIAAVTFLPFFPGLVRRVGLLTLMLMGGVASCMMILAIAWLDSVWAWLALQYVVEVGLLGYWVGGMVWINAAVTNRNRGKVLGLFWWLTISGESGIPLLLAFSHNSVLIDLTSSDSGSDAALYLSAALIFIALVPLVFASGRSPNDTSKQRMSLSAALGTAPTPMLSVLAGSILLGPVVAMLPLYGYYQGLLVPDPITTMIPVMVGGICAPLIVGWIADHVDRRRLLIVCGVVLLVASPTLPSVFDDIGWRVPLLFVWGASASALMTVALIRIGELSRLEQLGSMTATYYLVFLVSSAVGTILISAAMDVWNSPGFVAVTVATAFLFVAFGVWRYLTAPDQARAPGPD